jgi:heptosyltransferase-3
MKKAAIIPAKGFGDALLMLICAHQLNKIGYEVTIFHDLLLTFQNWFSYKIQKKSQITNDETSFDKIVIENDNSHFLHNFINRLKNKKKLHILYPSYHPQKNFPLTANDFVFNKAKTMVKNISLASEKLFQSPYDENIGIQIPSYLQKGKYINRVIIHPTSGDKKKNWHKNKFVRLAMKLRSDGLNPVFCTSLSERKEWLFVKRLHFDLPLIVNLQDLASYLYESSYFIGNDSGPGHLASYFQMPSIIVTLGNNNMKLWQPGWKHAELVSPSSWVPNVKYCRLRERKWQYFVTVNQVYQTFMEKLVNFG